MKPKVIVILAGLVLYLISSGVSFAIFQTISSSASKTVVSTPTQLSPNEKAKVKTKVDPSLPRDQVCPLNGLKYTTKEKDDWQTRRPLAIMIENSDEARPQSGLSQADIIYEALAEGWVTRFMAVYYCNTPFENITVAPVRSARTYFIDWVSEYDALYNHVGGANRYGANASLTDPRADALGQIDRFGIKDLDQFGIGYPDCYRNPDRLDHPVATEHTMVCFTDNLYKIAQKRGWTNVDEKGISWDKNFTAWKFKDDVATDNKENIDSIKVIFAQGYTKYDVDWNYDPNTNKYKRSNGGESQVDLETNEPIAVNNIVIQVVKQFGPVDDNGHMLYTTIGTGRAFIFQDGKAIEGTWTKKNRISRTIYSNKSGKEIEFNRGPIWIEIVGSEKQVTY